MYVTIGPHHAVNVHSLLNHDPRSKAKNSEDVALEWQHHLPFSNENEIS